MIVLLAIVVSAYGQLYFAKRLPEYYWVSQTISELASIDSPCRRSVALYYFTPVFILLCSLCIFWLWSGFYPLISILFLVTMPLSYLIAAIYPCDEGAPLKGSFSNNLHMIFGALQYLGTPLGFVLIAINVPLTFSTSAALYLSATTIVVCFMMMLLRKFRAVTGVVQRVAEFTSLFGWLALSLHTSSF